MASLTTFPPVETEALGDVPFFDAIPAVRGSTPFFGAGPVFPGPDPLFSIGLLATWGAFFAVKPFGELFTENDGSLGFEIVGSLIVGNLGMRMVARAIYIYNDISSATTQN